MAPPATATLGVAAATRERPPASVVGPIAWARANLFNSWLSSAVTLLLGYLIIRYTIAFIDWAFVRSIWTVPKTATGAPDATSCRLLNGAGACWAEVADKYRFILFGRYPYLQQWRPLICIVLFIGLYVISAMPRFWRKELAWVWLATLAVIGVLMWGGRLGLALIDQFAAQGQLWSALLVAVVFAATLVAGRLVSARLPRAGSYAIMVAASALLLLAARYEIGIGQDLASGLTWFILLNGIYAATFLLPLGTVTGLAVLVAAALAISFGGGALGLAYVPQDEWGGLPITLILATFGLAFAFPLAVLVALGRRSGKLPAVKMLCVLYVELIRGVPLISLLFMASVMFPLFMPVGLNPDKLLRAQVAFILFAGAYLAEVVRGGLQTLPKGQYEAADALGLSYWKKTFLIVLPQALRLVIPPLVNTFIGFFKDTSLVLIIGIFDLLTAGKVAMAEPAWQGFANEIYVVLGIIYFAFCFAMSKYSRGLEREFNRTRNR